MKRLLIFLYIGSIAGVIYGQNKPTDTVYSLPVHEVVASRLSEFSAGLKVEPIDSLTLQRETASNLGELLWRNTTLNINHYNYNGLNLLAARGTSTAQNGIYWNGLALAPSPSNLTDLSLIPTGFFEDIDVIYGGNSSLYGSGNVGAGIHLRNAPEFKRILSYITRISAGSFHDYSGSATIRVADRTWYSKSSFLIHTAKNDFSFINLKNQNEKLKNTALDQYGFMQDLYHRIGKRSLIGGAFWYQQNEKQIPATLTSKPSDAEQDDRSIRGMLLFRHSFPNGSFSVKNGFLHDFLHYTDPDSLEAAGIDSKITSTKYIAEGLMKNNFNKGFSFSSGVNISFEEVDNVNYSNFVSRKNFSAFAFLSKSFTKAGWKMNLNLRQEIFDSNKAPFTPSLGAEGKIWKWLSAKCSISRNYRIPAFNDLYWVPGGNPDLKPEISWNQEVSLISDYTLDQKRQTTLTVTAFNSDVTDLIHWLPQGSLWTPKNVGIVHAYGLETNVQASTDVCSIEVRLNGGYSFTKSIDKTDPDVQTYGKQLIFIPEHRFFFNLGLFWHLFDLSYNQSFTGARFITSDNAEFLPYYSLGNLFLNREFDFQKMKFFLKAEILNIWDIEYQAIPYSPMPGRSFKFSIIVNFNKS